MTSQPQPPPGEGRPVGQLLRPLRDLAAWALVAAPAVLLFVAVLRLIPAGDGESFGSRTQDSFYAFVNLATILFPLAAVLLSLLVQPRHPKAKLITTIALAEYAAAAFFGVLFGVLIGLINVAGFSVRAALEEFLARAAWLAVFGVAAWAVYSIWRALFYVPKPKAPPGVYGQPQYNVPGTFPGQPGYGPPPGQPLQPGQPGQPVQPGPPLPGQPLPGQSAQPGQPLPGQPAQPGQPLPGQPGQGTPGQPTWNQQAPLYGQPPVPPPSAYPPQSPPPGWGQPQSGAPTVPGMYGRPPAAEPTQVVPQATPSSAPPAPSSAPPAPSSAPPAPSSAPPFSAPPASAPPAPSSPPPAPPVADHTQVLPENRPGFGPADQDPPRG